MGADQTFRPQSTSAPAVDSPTTSTATPRDKTFQANVAGGGGNAYAASLAAPGQEAPAPAEETPGKPGMLDWAGAVLGSKHLRTMLGPTAKGVQWDDREKGANRMEVDVWGKDEVRVPKLRIAALQTAGASAKDVHADGIKVNERDKTRDGKLSADITVGSASAKDVAVANPALHAAGIDINGVKVHREFDGKRAVADVFSAPGPTTVEVAGASVQGLKAGGVSLDSASAQGLAASTDGTHHQLAARSASGTGLDVGGVHAGSIAGSGLAAKNGPEGTQVGLGSLTAGNVSAGDLSVGSLAANGFAASQDAKGAVKASLAGATGKDVKAGGAQLGEIGAVQLTMEKNADILTAGASKVTASGVTAGGATVAGASAEGVKFAQGAGGSSLSAQGASVSGVKSGDVSLARANVVAPSVSQANGVTSGGATSVDAAGLSAGGVDVASIGVVGPSFSQGPNGLSGGAKTVSANGVTGAVGARSVVAHDVSGGQAGGVTTAGVGDATVEGLSAGGVGVDTLGLEGGSFRQDAAGRTLGAKKASAAGINGKGVVARGAQVGDASVSLPSAGGVGVNVGTASVDQLTAGGTSLTGATASGVAVNSQDGRVDAGARRLGVTGLKSGDVSIGRGSASDTKVGVAGGQVDVSAGSASVNDLAAPGVRAGEVSTTGARVSVGGSASTAHARTVEASQVAAGDTRVRKASGSGVDFAKDAKGTRVGVAGATVAGVKTGGLQLEDGSVTDANVNVGANGTTTANAGAVSGTGIVTPSATVGSAKATKVGVTRTARSTRATAGTVAADKLHAGSVDAAHVDASGLDATLTSEQAGTRTNASVTGASASGLAFRSGTTRAKADKLRAGATSLRSGPTGTSVDTAGINASGVQLTTPGGVSPAGANPMADLSQLQVNGTVGLKAGTVRTGGRGDKPLVQQAANLVGSAQLSASVPLKARTQGSGTSRVTTQAGTTAFVEVQVSGGKLVPSGTKATFSKPLDTWAWTSVPGVYLTPEGKLYASVNGLWDMNMSEDVNKSLGGSGDRLPLSVGALAAKSGTAPEPGGPQISATLGQAPGANVASVNKDGDRSMTVNFSKLLLDALGVQTADAKVDVKGITATNAGVSQNASSTTVSAGAISTGRTTLTK